MIYIMQYVVFFNKTSAFSFLHVHLWFLNQAGINWQKVCKDPLFTMIIQCILNTIIWAITKKKKYIHSQPLETI